MRNAFGFIGFVCGAIIVAMASRFGYRTTDAQADPSIIAFTYGIIALAGMGMPAFTVYVWRISRAVGALFCVVSVMALAGNIMTSFGAISGRSESSTTEATDKNRRIKDLEREIKHLEKQRDETPKFTPTDAAAVIAAKRAADAATTAREAECSKRGQFCREREADERVATGRLSDATSSKALTDSARTLETEIREARDRLDKLGPPKTLDAQGLALARIFRLKEEDAGFASKVQQLVMSVTAELIVMAFLLAWEVSRPVQRREIVSISSVMSASVSANASMTVDNQIAHATKPRLVASNDTPLLGSIIKIMKDALERAPGQRVALVECARRYSEVCQSEGKVKASVADFEKQLSEFCKKIGIKMKSHEGKVYLMDVRLSQASGVANG